MNKQTNKQMEGEGVREKEESRQAGREGGEGMLGVLF